MKKKKEEDKQTTVAKASNNDAQPFSFFIFFDNLCAPKNCCNNYFSIIPI